MGWRYVFFRAGYEFTRKTGLQKRKYPTNPPVEHFISLENWKKNTPVFFFDSRETISFEKALSKSLEEETERILNGYLKFFSAFEINVEKNIDWKKNPQSNYRYPENQHWTEVVDYSKDTGDIKFVWEPSRFSFLYTIVRNDYHNNQDHSDWVINKILDWIEKNPINEGPNYKCSQEISLRVMNWTFSLYFYKNTNALTEENFSKIIHSIYWQLKHVCSNISFSRISVRNNHAITETLMLYIGGLLFPFFPESKKGKEKGKNWFEEEIAYQIYEDGTYLQFSMNYHRVVIQLLTWAIRLSDIHNEKFKNIVYERAYKSLNFLYQCQEEGNGNLPNYGSNDGALFFKLSDADYRDYRPQLDALHQILCNQPLYEKSYEDALWYLNDNLNNSRKAYPLIKKNFGIMKFPVGGFYLIREPETFTFIRCGKYKDRPAQADNLHIDIWHKGMNICPDGGSYQYNTDAKLLKYFMGTESHNTVMLDDYDQMLKGFRFVWLNWSQAIEANLIENEGYYEFEGAVSCFTYLNPQIVHKRIIRKYKNKPEWIITDHIKNKPNNVCIRQLWHYFTSDSITISIENQKDTNIYDSESWYSGYYGGKIKNFQTAVVCKNDIVVTKLIIK
jgi:hypothetical protein